MRMPAWTTSEEQGCRRGTVSNVWQREQKEATGNGASKPIFDFLKIKDRATSYIITHNTLHNHITTATRKPQASTQEGSRHVHALTSGLAFPQQEQKQPGVDLLSLPRNTGG